MRIALNMATLRGLGSRAIGQNLLREFTLHPGEHEYEAWIPLEWAERAFEDFKGSHLHRVPAGATAKILTENWNLRRTLRQRRFNKLLSLGDTSTIFPGLPHVLFVQQAHLAYFPAEWGFEIPVSLKIKMAIMSEYFRAGIPGVTRYIVQTQDMKGHLVKRWGIDPARVTVIATPVCKEWDNLADELPRQFPTGHPVICCPSGRDPHKNLSVLVPMLLALTGRFPEARLALTVNREAVPALVVSARTAGVLGKIDFRGRLNSDELRQLVSSAAVVVLPSLLESFGLAYYEAAAAGTPVVAADRAFAREALAGAAEYVPASEGGAFAEAVAGLLQSQSRWISASMAVREQYKATRRTWPGVAQEFLQLVEHA